jgi:hypothetical protein
MNGLFVFGSPAAEHGHVIAGMTKPVLQRRPIMKKFTAASILVLSLATAGSVFAQTTAPAPMTPSTPPAATAPSATAPAVTMDAAAEAKFKAADKAGKGMIEGAALEPFKPVMDKVDTDKDGKISRAEYAAATKSGIIK